MTGITLAVLTEIVALAASFDAMLDGGMTEPDPGNGQSGCPPTASSLRDVVNDRVA